MSCNTNSSEINQTFIIEPIIMATGPIISACTAVYANTIIGCDYNDNQIILNSGETLFNISITTPMVKSYDLELGGRILKYDNQSGSSLVGKFLSGTTNGFVLADVNMIPGIDTYVSGGTYSNGTTTFTYNNGNTFDVTGFFTGASSTFSGTTNYLSKFNSTSGLTNSQIVDNGTIVDIDNGAFYYDKNGYAGAYPRFTFGTTKQESFFFNVQDTASFQIRRTGSANGPQIRFGTALGVLSAQTNPNAGAILGTISFDTYNGLQTGPNTPVEGYQIGAYIRGVLATSATTGSSSAYLAFATVPSGSTTALERMYINNTGNILMGTGTDNGIDKLQINGSSYLGGPITIKGNLSSDTAVVGAELITTAITGTFDASWTGTNFVTGFTHITGFTTTLVGNLPAISGSSYYILITATNVTSGTYTFSFGGISYLSTSANIEGGIIATNTNNFIITPTSGFNGTLKVSIKNVIPMQPTQKILNSSNITVLETRAIGTSMFIGVGAGALSNVNTTTSVGIGYGALGSNGGGLGNTGIGSGALFTGSGFRNTAVGRNAMYNNTSGGYSVAIGENALGQNTAGGSNVVVGQNAMAANTIGSANVALGLNVGNVATNSTTSVFLGHTANPQGDNQSNQIVIGYFNTGLGSNSVVLGNSAILKTALRGAVLINTTTDNGVDKLQVNGSAKVDQLKYTRAIEISNSDLNSISDAGFYCGITLSNAPNSNAGWFYITIERYANSNIYVHQTATELGVGNTGNRIYSRINNGGAWGAWTEILTTTSNSILGTGTTSYLPRFIAAGTLGDSQLYQTGAGNIGIGTINPAGKLHVEATSSGLLDNLTLVNIAGTGGCEVGLFLSPTTATGNIRGARISAIQMGSNAIDLKFLTSAASSVPTERMRITSTGNLLINTTADTGTYKLQVSGTTLLTGDANINGLTVGKGSGNQSNNTVLGGSALLNNIIGNANIAVGSSALQFCNGNDNTAIGKSALIFISNNNNNTAIGSDAGASIFNSQNLTSADNSVFIGRLTKASGNGQTNQIVIGYGAIGIGSDSVVLGNDNITKTALKGNVLVGTTTDSGINGTKLQIWGNSKSNNTIQQLYIGIAASQIGLTSDGAYSFCLDSVYGFAERMRISSNGNLLIGTTTDNGVDKLQVNGSALVNGRLIVNGHYLGIGGTSTNVTNLAVGQGSLASNAFGVRNTAIGTNSLAFADSNENVGVGGNSGAYIFDSVTPNVPSRSVFIGYATTSLGTSQTNQIVIGFGAIGIGSNSAVIGNDSVTKTALKGNILIGTTADTAGYKLQVSGTTLFTGDANINGLTVGKGGGNIGNNTAFGVGALAGINTTFSNTAVGSQALNANTSGFGNVGVGTNALRFNNGNSNVGIGNGVFADSTGSALNTAVGNDAFGRLTGTTSTNVAIGSHCGNVLADKTTNLTSINNSTLLGYRCSPLAQGDINEIIIGFDANGIGSNSTVIGNTSTTKARIYGALTADTFIQSNGVTIIPSLTDVTITGTSFTINANNTRYICTSSASTIATVASGITGNIEVLRYGIGGVSFTGGTGTTLRYSSFVTPSISEQYATAALTKLVSAGEIRIYGELASI